MVIEGREKGDRWARNVKANEKARAQEETKLYVFKKSEGSVDRACKRSITVQIDGGMAHEWVQRTTNAEGDAGQPGCWAQRMR